MEPLKKKGWMAMRFLARLLNIKHSLGQDYHVLYHKKKINDQLQQDLQFQYSNSDTDILTISSIKTFLKLFAFTLITISEINQGLNHSNKKITLDSLNKNRLWSTII